MRRDEAAKLLQPYVDGELDAATCVEIERHLANDAGARAAVESLRALSSAVRGGADYHAAPAALRTQITALAGAGRPAPAAAARRWPFKWLRVAGFSAASAALAGALTFALVRPAQVDLAARDAFAGHVRAVVGDRLVDIASSDQHAIKPWLSARLGFSPPVHDFSGNGFELVGARIDVLGGGRAAVLTYRRRLHVIDVLMQPDGADRSVSTTAHAGYNLVHFARDGMAYWLVSDLNRRELADLARLLGARSI